MGNTVMDRSKRVPSPQNLGAGRLPQQLCVFRSGFVNHRQIGVCVKPLFKAVHQVDALKRKASYGLLGVIGGEHLGTCTRGPHRK